MQEIGVWFLQSFKIKNKFKSSEDLKVFGRFQLVLVLGNMKLPHVNMWQSKPVFKVDMFQLFFTCLVTGEKTEEIL